MLEFIVPALQNLLTIENLIWINLGVFIGSVFAAIPGLTVILCIILFLPFTYQTPRRPCWTAIRSTRRGAPRRR